ncbi:MAG: chemotaxis protein CheW [Nitrospirota bacterium]
MEITDEKNIKQASDEIQLAVFKLGGGEFALDIMNIMEIIRPQKVTKVPNTPQFVDGIITLRGTVVPVIDMRRRFKLEAPEGEARKAKVLVVKVGERLIGAMVDEVTEVIYLGKEDIADPPETVKGIGSEFLSGVGKVGGRLVIILDMEKLLTSRETLQLESIEDASEGNPEAEVCVSGKEE